MAQPKIDLKHVSSLDTYVAQINHYPILSKEEEVALAKRYQATGDVEAAHALVVANLRFVVKVAHSYRGYGLRLLDLVQEGNIGLMKAVKKFDADRGYRLISYGVWWIRAYMQNFIMRSWSLVKLGTTQGQRKLFFRLRSEREKLTQEGLPEGQSVAGVLAERLGVTETEVDSMQSRMAARDFSLHAETNEGGRETHLDALPSTAADQEEAASASERARIVRSKVGEAMAYLNEKERYIVEYRLMSEEPQTLQQIGQHFKISRERARQIEGKVLGKIKVALAGSGLEPVPA